MNHSMFTMSRNEDGYCIARILLPDRPTPIESPSMEHVRELKAYVRQTYGKHAQFVRAHQFEAEVRRRRVHTPEMIALLQEYGDRLAQDLSSYLVYGSANRPMDAGWASIPDAVSMSSDRSQTGFHTYVAVPARLSPEIIARYHLSFVSQPQDPGENREPR